MLDYKMYDKKIFQNIEKDKKNINGKINLVLLKKIGSAFLSNKLSLNLWLKREDCTPIGSFKFRGALIAMDSLSTTIPAAGVCVASAGNYGLAISTAG